MPEVLKKRFRIPMLLWNPFRAYVAPCPHCGKPDVKIKSVKRLDDELLQRFHRCPKCWKTFTSIQVDEELHYKIVRMVENKSQDIRSVLQMV